MAVECGADALGFIFYGGSPRYIPPAEARSIIDRLPPFVTPVAVVVNASIADVSEIMATSGCQIAQLHGDEPPTYLERLAWPAMKGMAIGSLDDLARLAAYRAARAILLDAKVAGQYGGTGTTVDWSIARLARNCGRPIILAGGLSPENVTEALTVAHPDAIDVSSRIEAAPGRKDEARTQALFAAVRAWDEARQGAGSTA